MVGQKKARAWRARQAVAAAWRASPAHGRHAAVALWRWSGRGAAQRGGRPCARAGLGQGERSAGWHDAWAGFGWRARKEATARERRKHFSKFLFLINFQISIFKYHFEQENVIF